MLENKLAWAPGSVDTILGGGEPTEVAATLPRTNPNATPHGYALRPSNPYALSQAPSEELLLELRRRIVDPRSRRQTLGRRGRRWTRTATGPNRADSQTRSIACPTQTADNRTAVKPS